MTKTLFAEVNFVSLIQKKPNDYGTKLQVNGETVRDKYSLEAGFGDPGEISSYDNFDYAEFQITGIYTSYQGSKQESYDIERPNGATTKTNYYKYSSFTVPDNFVIPANLSKNYSTIDDVKSKGLNLDGTWSFDWKSSAVETAQLLKASAISTGIEEVTGYLADKIFPTYSTAIKNVFNSAAVVFEIQKDGTALVSDAITNFQNYDPARFNLNTTSYLLSTNGALNSKLLEQAGMTSDLALSLVQGTYGATAITIKHFVPGDTKSGTIEIGYSRDLSTNYDTSSHVWIGSTGSDYHVGSVQRDLMGGGPGNDTFDAGPGNDLLAGGEGLDVSRLLGQRSEYVISKSNLTTIVQDLAPVRNGTDTLIDVERLQFSDGTLAFDLEGDAGQTYRLYQAAFDRTPDLKGLSHNIKLNDSELSLKQIGQAFLVSAEFQTLYGSNSTDEQFIRALYNNVLGRDLEAAGYAGWQQLMSNGSYDRGDVLIGFSESIENKALVAPAIQDGIWIL
ncbi:DUF4214 domain-containing protein [Methylobacterium sp. WL12]|uniref:DUF4214 domain-containing protein n=1 Tax=Methylobacterium sp. WL12 TaxID=2603890 RepID=UPI0011CC4439|nr:DUF4214 domain-containing protein [Methylobacterium sp. WL12]TXM65871.1 DUF4214 domain-containing protein [Methylobacterium sp. WL12]